MSDRHIIVMCPIDIGSWHYSNFVGNGVNLAGKNSCSKKLNSELFETVLRKIKAGENFTPEDYRKIVQDNIDAVNDVSCQTRSCDYYTMSRKTKNCKLDKKDDCYKNKKKYYSGPWDKSAVLRSSVSNDKRNKGEW